MPMIWSTNYGWLRELSDAELVMILDNVLENQRDSTISWYGRHVVMEYRRRFMFVKEQKQEETNGQSVLSVGYVP